MKKFILTIAMAVAGLGGLAPSAQAWCHPAYHCGYHWCGYHYHCGGYWYWHNGCRYWRVVVVPGPVVPPPCP